MLKVLGVGLSKTGTSSLHEALQILGYKSTHYNQVPHDDILDGSNPQPSFRRYDDVDAVTDLPAAYFYREILDAYPECKAILTVREVESWWKSMLFHANERYPVMPTRLSDLLSFGFKRKAAREVDLFRTYLRNCVYGSAVASEFLYKKKYREHNERVQVEIPDHRLLVMDITSGDGWERLCPFLDEPVPPAPFPHDNKTVKQKYLHGHRQEQASADATRYSSTPRHTPSLIQRRLLASYDRGHRR